MMWRWIVVGALVGFALGWRDVDRQRQAEGLTWRTAIGKETP